MRNPIDPPLVPALAPLRTADRACGSDPALAAPDWPGTGAECPQGGPPLPGGRRRSQEGDTAGWQAGMEGGQAGCLLHILLVWPSLVAPHPSLLLLQPEGGDLAPERHGRCCPQTQDGGGGGIRCHHPSPISLGLTLDGQSDRRVQWELLAWPLLPCPGRGGAGPSSLSSQQCGRPRRCPCFSCTMARRWVGDRLKLPLEEAAASECPPDHPGPG